MGHTNSHRKPSATSRRIGTAGAVVALSVIPLSTATASPAQAAEGDKTAVVGPLLDFFGFGTTVGAPVFCGTLSASLGSGFQELSAAEQGSAVTDGIDQGCATFAEQGNTFVEQGKAAQAPYAEQFNPVANPVIEQFATAVTDFGTTYEPALAPFGPTVAGSGNTIRFLVGSTPDGS